MVPFLYQKQAHAGSISAEADSFPDCSGPGSSVGCGVGDEGRKIIVASEVAQIRDSRGWSATTIAGILRLYPPFHNLARTLYLIFTVIRYRSRVIAGG